MGGLQLRPSASSRLSSVFQYRGRSWEGCNFTYFVHFFFSHNDLVSIPRTVVGGLQYLLWEGEGCARQWFQYRGRSWEGCNLLWRHWPCPSSCFNTEDGRGRAAMSEDRHHQQEPLQFQYRGRSWEGCNFWFFKMNLATRSSFNTEDGRGRAAIKHSIDQKINMNVSIPRTVVGGLQSSSSSRRALSPSMFQYRGRSWEGCNHHLRGLEGCENSACFNTEDGRGRAAIRSR